MGISTEYGLSLTAIAAICGVVWLWVFRRFADRERVSQAKRQVRARLYAMRLYGSEPAVVFRAQGQLLLWNARYLALMWRPAAWLLLPGIVLFTQLDNVYGRRPLARGESAVVTAQLGGGADLNDTALTGKGVVVETPAVRLSELRQVCWRVRASDTTSGSVILRTGNVAANKAVKSGPGLDYASESSFISLGGPVHWIEVLYPAAHLRLMGHNVRWQVWFLGVSLLIAVAASRAFPSLRL
ncbi:MAG: hypothetical protein ABSH50_06170 [Bryobacteraceae bacterium]